MSLVLPLLYRQADVSLLFGGEKLHQIQKTEKEANFV